MLDVELDVERMNSISNRQQLADTSTNDILLYAHKLKEFVGKLKCYRGDFGPNKDKAIFASGRAVVFYEEYLFRLDDERSYYENLSDLKVVLPRLSSCYRTIGEQRSCEVLRVKYEVLCPEALTHPFFTSHSAAMNDIGKITAARSSYRKALFLNGGSSNHCLDNLSLVLE